MLVRIRLLGAFVVTVDDREVPSREWRRRSAAALVKLLALQPGHRLLRDQVVDLLWPGLAPDRSAGRLHVAAHYARTALGATDAVTLEGGVVALLQEHEVGVDVARFEQAAASALAAGEPLAADAALEHYGGTLLPDDLYESWTEEPRERLRLRHLDLLRLAGRHEELVAADPLDEEAHLGLVRAQVAQGRGHAALRSLDRMEGILREELGVDLPASAAALRVAAQQLREQGAPPPEHREGPAARPAIPAPRHRLVGRGADRESVLALLERHRVVTIAGPGGAGKSTLALDVAREVQDGEAGETDVVVAELAPVREGDDVVRAVAEAAGVQGRGASRAAGLAAALTTRPVLLVLDNCEHLLDAGAALVDAVLDAGPHGRVLVTSREPLGVGGEAVRRLGSLGPDAAELFVERAVAAAGPGVVSVEDPRVVELCERLDGLPLAIELAAAQLGHLSLGELVERLDERLQLLAGGRPRAGARHSALGATIEWSYRLLSEGSRDLFDRLGTFPASFDLEAATAVAGGRPPVKVVSLLGDLVAKSLVVHDAGERRYRMLESIRLYARQRLLESGRADEVAELLRGHVVGRARRLPRVRSWLSTSAAARSRDDLDNVRVAFESSLRRGDSASAVDLALATSTMWRNAVSYTEGRRWVEELLAQELPPSEQVWAQVLAADVALGAGDPRGMRLAATAADAALEHVDEPGAWVIVAIYDALSHLDDPVRAVRRLEDARDRARAADEPGLERLARAFRVVGLLFTGKLDDVDDEVAWLVEDDGRRDYDRYICLWTTSLVAMARRDGPRLRGLLDAQRADLTDSGLRENWQTLLWGALTLISNGEDHVAQLRRVRLRAEAEGRSADPDCVMALGYAAACADDWERAAELLGAAAPGLREDTAGFVPEVVLRDLVVRPRLSPAVFTAAVRRGEALDVAAVLADHGV